MNVKTLFIEPGSPWENGYMKAFQKVAKLESIHKVMAVLSEEEIGQLVKLLEKVWYRALRNLNIERHPPFPPAE